MEIAIPYSGRRSRRRMLEPLDVIAAKRDIAKAILRDAYIGRIPESLRMRSKTSFPVPLDDWFAGPMKVSARDRLVACAEQTNWFDKEGILYLFSNGLPRGSGIAIWMALNLALFFRSAADRHKKRQGGVTCRKASALPSRSRSAIPIRSRRKWCSKR